MDTSLSKINAYILIGGQSRRLNTDKSLIKVNGETLTAIVHQKLSLIFDNIYIVGKENNFPEYNFIKDVKPFQCPLNGIVTAIEHGKNHWIFVIACDLPLIKPGTINCVFDKIRSNKQVVLPILGGTLQPLCAFYHKSVLINFNKAIEKGDYSLMKLLGQLEVKKVAIPVKDKEQFLNINYPKDLEKAERLLR